MEAQQTKMDELKAADGSDAKQAHPFPGIKEMRLPHWCRLPVGDTTAGPLSTSIPATGSSRTLFSLHFYSL
jgi:hypothetical protein